MQPHCYYLSVTLGPSSRYNFKILSSKKGEALADDLENQVREKLCELNGLSRDTLDKLFEISVNSIFDCGEEPEASNEAP